MNVKPAHVIQIEKPSPYYSKKKQYYRKQRRLEMDEFVDRQYSTVFSKHKMKHETKEIWKTQEDLIWLRYSENNENKKKGRFLQRKKFEKKEFRAIITYAQHFRFFWVKQKEGEEKSSWWSFFLWLKN